MTDVQCAAILFGDESYGRNWGHYCLLEAFRDLFERGNDRQYTFPDALASMGDSAFYGSMFFEEVSGGGNLDVEKTVNFLFELSNAQRVSMLLLTSPITGRLPARLDGQHRRAFPGNFGADVGIRLTERQIMCYGNNSYGDHMASSPRLASLLSFLNTTASGSAKLGLLVGKKGAIAQNRDSISNLVCFAVPHYVMSDRHIEYTVAIISELHARRHTIPGVRVTRGKEMRMRIFQSRVGSVPVASPEADSNSTQERTYLSEATQDINKLYKALSLDDKAWELLQSALHVCMLGWGQLNVPFEPAGCWSNASLNLCPFEYSVAVEQKTGKAHPKVHGKFAAWHSFVVGDNFQPEWKVYLNANASDPSNSTEVSREAFDKLSVPDSSALVKKVVHPNEKLMYPSLDLRPGLQARVKINVQYEGI
ncbi:beta-eliminating lyase [Colletotrichum musicola]|uniref:Beta-eliminating lyase n=1 Tax=Colletotrichum musicola TaxID=2175873 RepID=A0A8H6KB75_9PEZI|nr:beta-eliminating lyase [Colletotrichum musicola]